MKNILLLLFTAFFLLPKTKAENLLSNNLQQEQLPLTDTTVKVEKIEEEIIDEVIKTKAPPAKDKVQYFSQVTKYGFKNLFSKFSYNPTLSYSSQVNPSADCFYTGLYESTW